MKAHRAFFLQANTIGPECYFITVANCSHSREVEVTHVWFAFDPPIGLVRPERPLPKRLKPDEVWEIWTPLSQFSKALSDEAIFKRGRVRLSSGKVYNAKPEPKVVPLGNVPGGDVPPAVTGELVPPVKPQRMPSKRIVALLEAQLAEPIEEMRYDNPAVHEWYRITERLLGEALRASA